MLRVLHTSFIKRLALMLCHTRRTAGARQPQVQLSKTLFSQKIEARTKRFLTTNPDPLNFARDKLAGRNFAEASGVPTLPVIWSGVGRDLPAWAIEQPCALKLSQGCSSRDVALVRDGTDLMKNRKVSLYSLRRRFSTRPLRVLIDGDGAPIKECLMVEPLISGTKVSARPLDVRFFMFGDMTAAVHIQDYSNKLEWWFDQAGQPFPYCIQSLTRPGRADFFVGGTDADVLDRFSEAMQYATQIGSRLKTFCRIDFLLSDRDLVFGELSLCPRGGRFQTNWGEHYFSRMWAEHCPDAV
jgi:hypothetical protein